MMKKIAVTALAGTLALALFAAEPAKPIQPTRTAPAAGATTTKSSTHHRRHHRAPAKDSAAPRTQAPKSNTAK